MSEISKLRKSLEGEIATSYARKIKDYCRENKKCEECIFFNGSCGLCGFHPCDWDFKEKNADRV